MQIKFIDDNRLPDNYSSPIAAPNLEPTKTINGKKYTALGHSEISYSSGSRICRIFALIISTLTFGGALVFEKIRSDCGIFFTGKKLVVIYSSSNFLVTKILADRGNAIAQCKLGDMYYYGNEKIEKDYEKALKWYKKAANLGNARAQGNLKTLTEHLGKVKESDQSSHIFL